MIRVILTCISMLTCTGGMLGCICMLTCPGGMLGCISMFTCLEGVSAYACCHAPWHPDMDMHVVMSPGKMPGALEMPGGMSTCICMSIYQDQGASQHEKNMHFRMPGGHVKMRILPSQEGGCESRKQGGWEARKEWVCCVWVQARRHTKV